jgi:hypothetical protein
VTYELPVTYLVSLRNFQWCYILATPFYDEKNVMLIF